MGWKDSVEILLDLVGNVLNTTTVAITAPTNIPTTFTTIVSKLEKVAFLEDRMAFSHTHLYTPPLQTPKLTKTSISPKLPASKRQQSPPTRSLTRTDPPYSWRVSEFTCTTRMHI